MNQRSIWLVGEDLSIESELSKVIAAHGYIIEHKSEIPDDVDSANTPTSIVLSVVESDLSAINRILSAQRAPPSVPTIVIVAPHQIRVAVEALKLGASDALIAPPDPKEALAAIEAALKKSQNGGSPASAAGRRAHYGGSVIFSHNQKMRQIWKAAERVAQTDVPVLILGESGVGKEMLARFVHRASSRAREPLVKVNCAALPHDLLESEFFGYEPGAFTGAMGRKPGKFELADKGAIILDEIGEMPLNLQAKLLHVLEDGEYTRLGGKHPIKVDVRVFALTNRRLEEAVGRREFRDDLYFRLNVIRFRIPPLRERSEDIPRLCDYFFRKHRAMAATTLEALPPGVIDTFMRYGWPGNIRQLENTMKRYLILPELDLELGSFGNEPAPEPNAAKAFAAAAAAASVANIELPTPNDSICLKTLSASAAEHAERKIVLHVLEQTNWNRSQAARRLSICRRALLNKLKKWQIDQRRAS